MCCLRCLVLWAALFFVGVRWFALSFCVLLGFELVCIVCSSICCGLHSFARLLPAVCVCCLCCFVVCCCCLVVSRVVLSGAVELCFVLFIQFRFVVFSVVVAPFLVCDVFLRVAL